MQRQSCKDWIPGGRRLGASHLTSPLSRDLFQKAMSQSGGDPDSRLTARPMQVCRSRSTESSAGRDRACRQGGEATLALFDWRI